MLCQHIYFCYVWTTKLLTPRCSGRHVLCLCCLLVDTHGCALSAQSYNIIQLFLLANLLTSTSTIPVLMGLWHTPLGLKVRPASL